MKYTFETNCPIENLCTTCMKVNVTEIMNCDSDAVHNILSVGVSALHKQVSNAESKSKFPRKVFKLLVSFKESIYSNNTYTLSFKNLKRACADVSDNYSLYIGYAEKERFLCPQMYLSDSEGEDVRELITTDLSEYNPFGKLVGNICSDLIEGKIKCYER